MQKNINKNVRLISRPYRGADRFDLFSKNVDKIQGTEGEEISWEDSAVARVNSGYFGREAYAEGTVIR